MTRTSEVLAALTPLIADLARELPPALRYRRLLDALRGLVACDAVALLRLDGDSLVPLATHGLTGDTLGRRFQVHAHPRLQAIMAAPGALLFPPDSTLPDPYDGLVGTDSQRLEVHDCMGCTLRVGEDIWGMLTLDALDAGRFSRADLDVLDTFASLAAATVAADARFLALADSVEHEKSKADAFRQALVKPGQVLTGQSAAFQQLIAEIDLVAPSDLTVLVTGETGVGKELVARRLHAQSSRAEKTLVSVNCAALPEHLVESELFGHVRGSFSGAIGDRLGKFEMAHGGTLFLDEVGELPLPVQAKLLRVLQDGQLQRIGSDREHHADIRLIAATNRDLAEEVRKGRFRADLYHRLGVFPLRVPSLRERATDVLLLAGTFIEENRRRTGLRGLRLSADAERALQSHSWPGNVRELEYLIARATLKARGRHSVVSDAARTGIVTLETEDLHLEPASTEGAEPRSEVSALPLSTGDLRTQVDRFQRALIESALKAHGGNVAAAARALGQDRGNLVRLARRLGIAPIATPDRTPF
ncbi:nitric oxide reductase transcriptional regulator NorR [Comamonadaceae bacterium PP-2]